MSPLELHLDTLESSSCTTTVAQDEQTSFKWQCESGWKQQKDDKVEERMTMKEEKRVISLQSFFSGAG